MMDAAAFPFARAAAALVAYERNARGLAGWIHASWLAHALHAQPHALGRLRQALDAAGRANMESCSRALVRAVGVMPPEFNALRRPGPALLDCLPAEMGLQVLRMRAVWLRRAEARRLIEKRSRMQISEWIGISLDRMLNAAAQGGGNAPDINRLISRAQVPSLDRLDADQLADEGYALVMRDLHAVAPPFALLRLALPKSMPAVGWVDDAAATDTNGTAELFAQLGRLLPEWAWLFG